jgi:hypothetical protein
MVHNPENLTVEDEEQLEEKQEEETGEEEQITRFFYSGLRFANSYFTMKSII